MKDEGLNILLQMDNVFVPPSEDWALALTVVLSERAISQLVCISIIVININPEPQQLTVSFEAISLPSLNWLFCYQNTPSFSIIDV